MAKTIAVAGKGGTGKTTFNAFLIKYLLERGKGSILAVDADPNANLNEVLGLEVPLTISDVLEDTKNPQAVPQGMSKEMFVQYRLSQAVIETSNLDLLVMGRPEGPGCYCYANNLLRGHLESLSKNYDYMIVDNEAGMEHISRKNIETPDELILTSDSSVRGIRSAKRVFELIRDMKISVGRIHLVVTMTRSDEWKKILSEVEDIDVNILGGIPYDPLITEYDENAKPLLEMPEEADSVKLVFDMLDSIFKEETGKEELKWG